MLSRGSYLLIVAIVAALAACGFYAGSMVSKAMACAASQPGAYLAYCNNTSYASYEHAALGNDLEPRAVEALKQAEVLILGNSRAMTAFSTKPVDEFFKKIGHRYYVMSFGYDEFDLFPEYIIKKYGLKPMLIIINADPFFANLFSVPGKAAAEFGLRSASENRFKQFAASVIETFCSWGAACRNTTQAIYRSRETGQWIWRDTLLVGGVKPFPFDEAKRTPIADGLLRHWNANAQHFLERLRLPDTCIILTSVPNQRMASERVAEFVAEQNKLLTVNVEGGPYLTYDGSHLDAGSADRWSAAFLEKADPLMRGCIGR